MQEIDTKLGKVAVFNEGDSSKKSIVFLHGVFLSHRIWDEYRTHFKANYNVIALDWFGHGQSQSPLSSWTLGDSVEVVREVLDALKLSKAILVGHSWGGMASLRLADLYPDRVEALALFNTPLAELSFPEKCLHLAQASALPLRQFYGTQAANSIYHKQSLEKRPEWKAEVLAYFNTRSFRDIFRVIKAVLLGSKDSFDQLRRLKTRWLVVVGESDYVLGSYKENRSKIPMEDVKVIRGGHTAAREDAQNGIKLLEEFLWGS